MDKILLSERIATVDHRIALAIALEAKIELLQETIKRELFEIGVLQERLREIN